MKYTQAREIVEAALDVLNEGMMPSNNKMKKYPEKKYNSIPEKKYNSMEKSKPSMPSVKKPSSPSPSSGLSPAVKMGARNTNARWRRGNRWVLKQIAKKRQASTISEDEQTNARYAEMGDKIWKETEAYQKGKPGSGRRLKSLIKRDYREAKSATLYGRGGKKIKNPKKHRDSRPLREESERGMSARNIKTYQGHIDRLKDVIKYHSSRKPGWSDLHGNQTQSSIDAKVKDLTRIHKELASRHKKALANHASGNYATNRGHYLLNTDWH